MSFKAEVIADGSGEFVGNGLRFASREEAEAYARDLSWRWLAVRDWRVIESDDAVSDAWVDGRPRRVEHLKEEAA